MLTKNWEKADLARFASPRVSQCHTRTSIPFANRAAPRVWLLRIYGHCMWGQMRAYSHGEVKHQIAANQPLMFLAISSHATAEGLSRDLTRCHLYQHIAR